MNGQQKKPENRYGHLWDALDTPTLDDEGDYASYAKCSKCGAIENTDESIKDCPNENQGKKTCLNADCPERFSLCCGAICMHDLRGNKPEFICSKCKKEWQAGKCNAQVENKIHICHCSIEQEPVNGKYTCEVCKKQFVFGIQ